MKSSGHPVMEHRENANNLVSSNGSEVRNVELVPKSLSTGSKNNFKAYRARLKRSGGDFSKPNSPSRNIDWEVWNTLQSEGYFIHPKQAKQVFDYLYNLKLRDGSYYSSSQYKYSDVLERIKAFSTPDYTSFRWNRNYQKSLNGMKDEFSKLHLKPLVINSPDELLTQLPRKESHSGAIAFELNIRPNDKALMKSKGELAEVAFNYTQERRELAIKAGSLKRSTAVFSRTTGHPGIDEETGELGVEEPECTTRPVCDFDYPNIIFEIPFSRPIQNYLARKNYYAGGQDDNHTSMFINDSRSRYHKWLSIDYSRYDQSISSWILEDVFSIIKEAFVFSNDEEGAFNVVVHDFIHKVFLCHDHDQIANKGVPSGSMFTQIVDTLVNRLLITTYFNAIHSDFRMIAMGDDNLIFTNADTNIRDLASYIAKNFGMKIHDDAKSSEGLCKDDPPKFLSRFWRYNGQWRHPNVLLAKMLYPERFRKYGIIDGMEVSPYHVITSYILTYPLGMYELIDVNRFKREHPISRAEVEQLAERRLLPGNLQFLLTYQSAKF